MTIYEATTSFLSQSECPEVLSVVATANKVKTGVPPALHGACPNDVLKSHRACYKNT